MAAGEEDVLPRISPESDARVVMVNRPSVRLHVFDGGEGGLPVLFVHGLAGDSGVWAGALSHLRATRRAAAFDLRGHGRSTLPADGRYAIEDLASDVGAVADELGFRRFVLVGHSLGGAVVGCYAGAHPDRIAGLLLVDPAGDVSKLPKTRVRATRRGMEPATFRKFMEGWFGKTLLPEKPETEAEVFSTLRRTDPRAASAAYAGLAAYHPVAPLKSYRGPAALLVRPGTTGPLSIRALLPSIPAEEVPETGHWIMLDDPETFHAKLDTFLAKLK